MIDTFHDLSPVVTPADPASVADVQKEPSGLAAGWTREQRRPQPQAPREPQEEEA